MTVLILIISLLTGIVLAEITLRAFGGLWYRCQLRKIRELLQAFREADGDDARQAILLRSGLATLRFSLFSLGLLVGLAAIAVLAPWLLDWDESQQMAYFVASSVAATGWWILRPPTQNPHSKLLLP